MSYYRARKILNMKLFDDESNKKWKKSVVDKQFEILCVSQFTLYNTWKVNIYNNIKKKIYIYYNTCT